MKSQWPMVKLGDVLNYEQPTHYIVNTTQYDDTYPIPVLTAGQTFILGYTNETENIYHKNLPVLIFDDFTTAIKYVDFPFKVKSSAMKILSNDKSKTSIKYLFYAMGRISIDTELHKRYWISLYSNISIPLPPLSVQLQIVQKLDKVQLLIEQRKYQIEKLDLLAKSRFIEMFGDVSCNDKGWKIAKMSEISTSRLGKMLDAKKQTGQCSFPYLANINVRWFGFDFSSLRQMDFNEADQQEFSLLKGDLLVCEGGEVGRCAVWDNEISPCFYQKALHRIRCDFKKILPEYLAWWFKCNCDKEAFENVAGAKATIAHLPGVKLKNLNVATPPISLQQDFVTFLRELDKSKFTIHKSLEKLKTLYRALLQEYFG